MLTRNILIGVVLSVAAHAQTPTIIKDGAGSGNAAQVTGTAALKVDGSAATQPISGTVTATQATAASLNATVVGTGTLAVQNTAATPAGSNVIGHVIADSGSTTVVTGTTAVNLSQVVGAAPDPCFGQARTYFSISQTTNTQIITGTSAKKIYFCSFNVVAGDAENISVVEGTATVCATATIAVPGFPAATAAAGWNFAANGGMASNGGAGSMAGTSVNADNVCLFQSGSGRVAGGGSYVVQ